MRTLGLIVAVTALLAGGTAQAELVAGQATTVSHPMLQVSGSGTVQVTPDTVRVTASVVTQAATLEEARERNAEIAQRALEAVKALKLRNVVTRTVMYAMQRVTRDASITNSRVDPSALGVPWKLPANPSEAAYFTLPFPVLLGYQATNSVTARVQGVPADELSGSAARIVDALMVSGCNQITSVAYSLEQDQLTARREALMKAVKDAQMTAETVAAAAGRKITGVRSITPSYWFGASDWRMQPYGMGGGMGGSGGYVGGGMGALGSGSDQLVATALASGQLELAAQVQVSYELDYNAGDTQFLPAPGK